MSRIAGLIAGVALSVAPLSQAQTDVQRGEQLFTALCSAYCHGRDPGKREAPYLFDCEWLHGGSEEEIFATVSNGVPDTRMVSFGGKLPNGDDDIRNLVSFLMANSGCQE
ncbi:MAG: c-type cytochrome [Desulfobacterales bacterium]